MLCLIILRINYFFRNYLFFFRIVVTYAEELGGDLENLLVVLWSICTKTHEKKHNSCVYLMLSIIHEKLCLHTLRMKTDVQPDGQRLLAMYHSTSGLSLNRHFKFKMYATLLCTFCRVHRTYSTCLLTCLSTKVTVLW